MFDKQLRTIFFTWKGSIYLDTFGRLTASYETKTERTLPRWRNASRSRSTSPNRLIQCLQSKLTAIHFLSVEFTSCLPPANGLAYQHQIVSPDRLPNGRRPESTDAEERKRRGLEKVRSYLDTPTVEDVLVNEHTKAHRKWLMGRWNKYIIRCPKYLVSKTGVP